MLSLSSLLTDDIMNLRVTSVLIQVSTSSKQSSAGLAGNLLRAFLGREGFAGPAAHFRLFFQLQALPNAPNVSIEVNSTLATQEDLKQDKKTILRIIYRDYQFSNGAELSNGEMIDFVSKTIPIQSSHRHRPVLVVDLINLLLSRGRHRYQLHGSSGSGCRFFCTTVLHDCIQAGWLSKQYSDIVEDITKELKGRHSWAHVDLPIPAPMGTFY